MGYFAAEAPSLDRAMGPLGKSREMPKATTKKYRA
jgi:hypothetical protein